MTAMRDPHRRAAAGTLAERLRTLPDPPLPDGLLDDIRRAACDAPAASGGGSAPRPAGRHEGPGRPAREGRAALRPWRGLAAAAALALAATAGWLGADRAAAHAEEARLAALEHDLQLAMTRVGRALARAERITVDDALGASTATLRRGALAAPGGAPGRHDLEPGGITP